MNPIFDIPDLKELLCKVGIVFGALIVIYGVLWLFVTLKIIPAIIAAVFPQIVIIVFGLFVIYIAVNRKNKYY